MIEINVTPALLRAKRKKRSDGLNIPMEIVVGSAAALIILLVAVHVVLLMINSGQLIQYKNLKSHWLRIQPEKREADKVVSELHDLQEKQKSIKNLLEGGQLLWARKLNILSDSLSRGVWLRRVVLTKDSFFIEGSTISRQNTEMLNVHNFASSLQDNEEFLKNFSQFDLGSIKRRNVGKTEIADFLITIKLK